MSERIEHVSQKQQLGGGRLAQRVLAYAAVALDHSQRGPRRQANAADGDQSCVPWVKQPWAATRPGGADTQMRK